MTLGHEILRLVTLCGILSVLSGALACDYGGGEEGQADPAAKSAEGALAATGATNATAVDSAIAPKEPDWPNLSPFTWTDPENPGVQITLVATLLDKGAGVHTWSAQAYDGFTGDLIGELDAVYTYGPKQTVLDATYQRHANSWGFEPFGPEAIQVALQTEYRNGTIQTADTGNLTWLAATMTANSLDLVVGDEGWTSNGCNKPCSNKWKACCDVHDACYCKGGNAADRKKCDDDFKACLLAAGMGRAKAWAYHHAVRTFGWRFFNCTAGPPKDCK